MLQIRTCLPLLWLLCACGDEGLRAPEIDDLLDELERASVEDLVAKAFEAELRRDPEAAILAKLDVAIPEGALTPVSEDYERDNLRLMEGIADLLDERDPSQLSPDARLDWDTYRYYVDDAVRGGEFLEHDYLMHHRGGALSDVEYFFFAYPLTNEADAWGYLAHLGNLEAKIDQIIDALERRERHGIALTQPLIDKFIASLAWDGLDPEQTFYLRRIIEEVTVLPDVDNEAQQKLIDSVTEVVRDSIIPAYARLHEYFVEARESAPTEPGVGRLPDGDAYYAHLLRHHTTTEMTADEIHELGLVYLDEIQGRMHARFAELGYPNLSSLRELLEKARLDSGMLGKSSAVKFVKARAEEAERRLPEAFDLGSAFPWLIEATTDYDGYSPPAPDGSRPGTFYFRLILDDDRAQNPKFGLRTLVYHELIPGHHLQSSRELELDPSLFNQHVHFNGYSEGWGHYAERLSSELGWYDEDGDPLGDLEWLQAEAFRAARLVVDTGLHTRGWSAEEAIAFMDENVAMPEMEEEVSRYSIWPGQATAYSIGMMTIVRLREEAKVALGDRFDLRAFHSVVLDSGSIPLPLLEQRVHDWIAAQ